MSVRLSICIPTYNRSDYLKKCLDSVLRAAKEFKQQIEIVISDNASTDSTRDVVMQFQAEYPWIRYHRNEMNIGADRNIYAVASMGTGEYIWVIGDDDKIEAEAIEIVLQKIALGYDPIICNYSVWNRDFSEEIKMDGLHAGKDRLLDDRNLLLMRFHLHVGYISSVIIRKEAFFQVTREEYWRFIDYGFPFMFAVYASINPDYCRAAYISVPIVCNRSGNSGDFDWYKYFIVGSLLIFDALATNGYKRNAVKHAKHMVLKDFILPNLLRAKMNRGKNLMRYFLMMFKHYKRDWLFWAGLFFVFMVPAYILHMAKNVILKIRQVRMTSEAKRREIEKQYGN